ncbi:hypothetical protein, partial [Okeania sp. SIO2G5]
MTQQHITLITGASRGIGLSTVDLSDRHATTETLANLTKQYSFDGVVNNVGIVHPQPLEEVT